MNLGTILPTADTFRQADQFARRQDAMKAAVAERSNLTGLDRRVVGGEVRYYDTTDQYAIVSRQGTVLWFQVKADGDYRI